MGLSVFTAFVVIELEPTILHVTFTSNATRVVIGPPSPPTFATDIYPILSANSCTSCHVGGASAPGNLDLSTSMNAFSELVGMDAVCSTLPPGTKRVFPHCSSKSFLPETLKTNPFCGSAMPLAGTPLQQSDIDMIRAWIDGGAQP